MPNYAFYCESCEARADEYLTFEQHGQPEAYPTCAKCDRRMKIMIESAPAVSGNGFQPYWNTGLGRVVHSAHEQDTIAKSLGLEMRGD